MLWNYVREQPIGLISHDAHLGGVVARLNVAEKRHTKRRLELIVENGDENDGEKNVEYQLMRVEWAHAECGSAPRRVARVASGQLAEVVRGDLVAYLLLAIPAGSRRASLDRVPLARNSPIGRDHDQRNDQRLSGLWPRAQLTEVAVMVDKDEGEIVGDEATIERDVGRAAPRRVCAKGCRHRRAVGQVESGDAERQDYEQAA